MIKDNKCFFLIGPENTRVLVYYEHFPPLIFAGERLSGTDIEIWNILGPLIGKKINYILSVGANYNIRRVKLM